MASRTWRGESPDAAVTAMPVAMRRLRPATRTMKNSSRFEAKIARNRTRSSSGRSGSSASSRTRSLNASHEISRSAKRSSGSGARSSPSKASSGSSASPWGTGRPASSSSGVEARSACGVLDLGGRGPAPGGRVASPLGAVRADGAAPGRRLAGSSLGGGPRSCRHDDIVASPGGPREIHDRAVAARLLRAAVGGGARPWPCARGCAAGSRRIARPCSGPGSGCLA